jgi:hypothetical protein
MPTSESYQTQYCLFSLHAFMIWGHTRELNLILGECACVYCVKVGQMLVEAKSRDSSTTQGQ